MSFFGKFKPGSDGADKAAKAAPAKKDLNAIQPTPLEKHLADFAGPIRPDGSDKFFGFENVSNVCYCNSIVQCLYYSAPFRENVINFPSKAFLEHTNGLTSLANNDAPIPLQNVPGYPNPTSPARKQPPTPGSPAQTGQKPEESKDSPEYRKRLALAAGPVLDMTYDGSKRYGMDESLYTALKDIFEAVIGHQSRIGVVSPYKFLEILRRENEMFRSAMHQDAHEFLNLLLNQVVDNVELFSKQHPDMPYASGGALEKGTNGALSLTTTSAPPAVNNTDWVHDLFEGLLTSETRCLTCENTSQRDEAFLDLSVDLAPHTSVTSCLRKFSEEEMLCERNKFHCDNCGGLQEAEKRMKIKRSPRILALHLKRFKYTEDLARLQKLFHRVNYPFHLRLFNTTDDAEDPDRLYELYAVVVHIGGGPYHGHYVSIIKTQDRGWLLFDDELVEPVDKSYVLNFFGGEAVPGVQDAKQLACAYVLFYQETTQEAMERELEAEGQVPSGCASDAGTVDTHTLSPVKNGLYHSETIATPIMEEMDHFENLAHAATAPPLPVGAVRPPLDIFPTSPLTPEPPLKSKKERQKQEKERKAAEKEAEKEAMKKRREASERRITSWKKQEEELKQALEESKTLASEEAQKRGELDPTVKESKGGLARFRPGSMSLRQKPKILGGSKEKGSPATGGAVQAQAAEPPTAEKEKKTRFSLSRKKSAIL